MSMGIERSLVEKLEDFLKSYYKDELAEFALGYPKDNKTMHVSWRDLYTFDMDIAEDCIDFPSQILPKISKALSNVDLPVDIDLSDAEIAIVDFPGDRVKGVADLRADDAATYGAVEGDIAMVTPVRPKITEAAFRCQRCECLTTIPQVGQSYQEPHECDGCDRQGPFRLDKEQSTFVNRRKIQLKQPPEQSSNGEGDAIAVLCEGDTADRSKYQLERRVGEEVTVYGCIDIEQRGTQREKKSVFDPYVNASSFDFERDSDDIDIEAHREEFEAAASEPNAYQLFIESMAPDIYPIGRWPLALKLGAAYLMGGVRIDPLDGSTYRGDIHMAIISPPGVGKSKFASALNDLSPGGEYRSATGLSSEVGLTAAAVRSDFDESNGWVLRPGMLARASDHVILDEADKTNASLEMMNDALEGKQLATVDKAGINASIKTRIGLCIMANPDGGRWDDNAPVKAQVDIDDTLWSRFDGIVLLEDQPDPEEDKSLAGHVLQSYRDNFEQEFGDGEVDEQDSPVSKDAMRAWIKYARENIQPRLTNVAANKLEEYYVDVRNDDTMAENSHPTPRRLEAGIRFATAFAKIRLSETVEQQDVSMAVDLSKAILGQTISGGKIDADVFTEAEEFSQKSRKKKIQEAISDTEKTVEEIADEIHSDERLVESDLEKWHRRTNPSPLIKNGDKYRWVG